MNSSKKIIKIFTYVSRNISKKCIPLEKIKRDKNMIRVGKADFDSYATFKDFTQIVVLTKSSEYGSLSPYLLKDKEDRIMENIWQFMKVYPKVPKVAIPFSGKYKKIVWE